MMFKSASKIILYISGIIVLMAQISNGAKVSGTIISDTVWTNDEVVEIIGNVNVASIASLTIEAGTVVRVGYLMSLEVAGHLAVEGREGEQVIFTSAADTAGGDPSPGDWYSILFTEGASGAFNYCTIRNSINSIYATSATIEAYDCRIENFMSRAFFLNCPYEDSLVPVTIDHCVITQSDPAVVGVGIGIYALYGYNLSVSHTEVTHCRNGIEIVSGANRIPHFLIRRCEISKNTGDGIYAYGSG